MNSFNNNANESDTSTGNTGDIPIEEKKDSTKNNSELMAEFFGITPGGDEDDSEES